MDTFFNSSWDEIVNFSLHIGKRVVDLYLVSLIVTLERVIVFLHVFLHVLNVKPISLVNGTVVLNDASDFATVLLQELTGPVAHITKTLDSKCLTFDSQFFIASLVNE